MTISSQTPSNTVEDATQPIAENNEAQGDALKNSQTDAGVASADAVSEQEASPSNANPSEDWQAKHATLQDQFTRLAADFDNFRKRSRDEQDSLLKYGAQNTAQALLPVLDNLERATASLNENSDPKVLYKSFQLVYKQLTDGLEGLGVKKIAAIGQPFDPQHHEAVNRMPSADVPENNIVYEAQSGYMLHEKVLRPAQVVVSTGAGDTEENPFTQS